jgi:endonuclease YncB( thermonuclease family)
MRPIALLVLALLPFPALAQEHPTVTDGDTLKFGAQRVRMFGIDAPESKQTCDDGAWPAGKIATETLRELIGGRPVTCTQVDWDGRYHRPVSLCFAGATDLSAAMIDRGMAWAFVRYSAQFIERERGAALAGLGVHGHRCVPAWEWRAQQRASVGGLK